MAYKSNINGQIRGFYYAASGKEIFSGQTIETPKLLIQSAINAAFALSPPPSGTDIALVTGAQGGSFTVGFTLSSFIQFNGQDTSISVAAFTAVTLASGLRCQIESVSNSQASSNVFLIIGLSDTALFCGRCGITGSNSLGVSLSGTLTDVFINIVALENSGLGATGILVSSTNAEPLDINVDTVGLEANNTTFIHINTPATTDLTVLSVSSVDSGSSTGTTAFLVNRGILVVETAGDISAATAINVTSGGTLRISAGNITGNITVATGGLLQISALQVTGTITIDSGGTMEADIISHSGTLTNNGTLTGQVNSDFFGIKTFSGNITLQPPSATDIDIIYNNSSAVEKMRMFHDESASIFKIFSAEEMRIQTTTSGSPVGDLFISATNELNITALSELNITTTSTIPIAVQATDGTMDFTSTSGLVSIGSNSGNVVLDSTTGNVTVSASGIGFVTVTPTLRTGFGTELLPAYTFTGDTDTGMRRSAANTLNFSAGGFDVAQMTADATSTVFLTLNAVDDVTIADTPFEISVESSTTDTALDISGKGTGEVSINNGSGAGFVKIGRSDVLIAASTDTVGIGLGLNGSPSAANDLALDIRKGTAGGHTSSNLRLSSPVNGNALTIGIGDTVVSGGAAFFRTTFNAVFQNINDSLTGFQVLDADGGTPVFNVDTINERVGVGTAAPASAFHLFSAIAAASNITIENTQTNSFDGITLRRSSTERWFVGLNGDDSNADFILRANAATNPFLITRATGAITLQNGTDSSTGFQILDADGGTPIFNVDTASERIGINTNAPDTALDVEAAITDTVALIEYRTTGANGGEVQFGVGERTPQGNRTGSGGSVHFRDSGDTSGIYLSLESSTGTNWHKVSVDPATTIEIHNLDDLEDLATAGTINITTNTTLVVKAAITTSSVFNVTTGDLNIVGSNIAGVGLTYSGTGTFFTVNGDVNLRIKESCSITASSTGTFVDYTANTPNTGVIIDNCTLSGWKLGKLRGGGAVFSGNAAFVLYTEPLTLENSHVDANDLILFAGTRAFEFVWNGPNPSEAFPTVFNNLNGFTMFGAPVRIDPLVLSGANYQFNVISTGSSAIKIFDTTGGSTGAFTAVANASITATVVTSVTDTGGSATFNHGGTSPLVGATVTISGYTTNTAYNSNFIVSTSLASSFTVQDGYGTDLSFGTGESGGSFVSAGVLVTATAHGLSANQTLRLDTTLSTDYDGGFRIYNVMTNSFNVAATFAATEAGTWDTSGIDESFSEILVTGALINKDSKNQGFGTVNANASSTSITDGTYVAANVTGFSEDAVTEGFKLINSTNGIIELTALKDFSGFISGSLSALKTGSTSNYRFAASTNSVVPTFATAAYIPMEVKTTKVNIALEFSVDLSEGDTIQIMVAGDSTSDSLTITDFVIGIQ